MEKVLEKSALTKITPATDAEIIAYLRHSHKIAEVAALAELDRQILHTCELIGITVSDEELQAAGDAFRLKYKLFGSSETIAWLSEQRITLEDWSQGIKIELLTKKLKEYLFGDVVDQSYLNNRNNYKRVALSQILVSDLSNAVKLASALREENASFCALALEHSQGKQSKQNGGFMGIVFTSSLMPEIAEAILEAKEGEAIGPIQTKLGYHIIKIEKWFPIEFNEVREQVLETLFQEWLSNQFLGNT